jgi:alpha-L-fucosidase
MGNWLAKYGESIYGTNGGPYPPNAAYSATRKGNKVYVHLLARQQNNMELPALPGVKVMKASLMHGAAVQLQEKDGRYQIVLPAQLPDSIINVLVLELDKPAIDIPVLQANSK